MNIQIIMNQKKKTTIAQSTDPNVHSYASTGGALPSLRGFPAVADRHRGY
jgi:hypothetical protein